MKRKLENIKKLFVILFATVILVFETTNVFATDFEDGIAVENIIPHTVHVGMIIDGFDGNKEIVVEVTSDGSFITTALKASPYASTHNHQMYQLGQSVYQGITRQGRNGTICYHEVYKVLFKCKICGYKESRTVYITKYHYFSSGRCRNCGLVKKH